MSTILGIWTGIDSGACVVKNGVIEFSITEERINRIKHYAGIPNNSISYIFKKTQIKPSDINYVVISSRKNLIYFKRLFFYNSFNFFIRSLKNFILKNKYIAGNSYKLRKLQKNKSDIYKNKNSLEDILLENKINAKIINLDHHEAHVKYSFFLSNFDKAISISLDGEGGGLSGMVSYIDNKKFRILQKIGIHGQSLGFFYGCVTEALGFSVNDGEGKTMGLAPYGEKINNLIEELSLIAPVVKKDKLISKKVWDYVADKDSEGKPKTFFRDSYYVRNLIHKYGKENVAYAAQYILEKIIRNWIFNLANKHNFKNIDLVLSGGVALNISNNFSIWKSKVFKNVFIPPAPGDNGLPMALALVQSDKLSERKKNDFFEPYYGGQFNKQQILEDFKKYEDKLNIVEINDVADHVSDLLINGKIVGWFHGKSEWGNRALGNRSVIADPRDIKTKDKINLKLKERDEFMPFAPSVLSKYAKDIFEDFCDSFYMNHKFVVNQQWKKKIPAVVHIDGTARPNFVNESINKNYYNLINKFYEKTSIPLVLNTSFNKHGLPIVETPKDAFDHLLWDCVEVLSIGPFICIKK